MNYHWYRKPLNGPYPPKMIFGVNCEYIGFENEPEPKVIDQYRLIEIGVMTRVEFRSQYSC